MSSRDSLKPAPGFIDRRKVFYKVTGVTEALGVEESLELRRRDCLTREVREPGDVMNGGCDPLAVDEFEAFGATSATCCDALREVEDVFTTRIRFRFDPANCCRGAVTDIPGGKVRLKVAAFDLQDLIECRVGCLPPDLAKRDQVRERALVGDPSGGRRTAPPAASPGGRRGLSLRLPLPHTTNLARRRLRRKPDEAFGECEMTPATRSRNEEPAAHGRRLPVGPTPDPPTQRSRGSIA